MVGENIGVGNGDEFHVGATIAGGDDPDAADTAAAKVPLDEIRRYVMIYNAVPNYQGRAAVTLYGQR